MKKMLKAYDIRVVTDFTAEIDKEDYRQLILVGDAGTVKVSGDGYERTYQSAKGNLHEVDLDIASKKITIEGASVAIFADKGDIDKIVGQPDLYEAQNTKPNPTQKNDSFNV